MKCVYEVKKDGKVTTYNEYEFADFIQGMESLKKYGATDVVFSSVRDLTLEKVKELFKHGRSNISLTETPDLDSQTETTEIEPYSLERVGKRRGVTDFLGGLVNSQGKLLFPEFRPQEFWKRAYERWDDGDFTEEEKEVLFQKDGAGNYIIDPNQTNDMRKAIFEEKWKTQRYAGTTIHKVMETFFSKVQDVGFVRRLTDDAQVLSTIRARMTENQNKVLTDAQIMKLVALGRKIVEQFGEEANYFAELKVISPAIDPEGESFDLVGCIDLFILDEEGKLHIVDYKTSDLDYGVEKQQPKQRAYSFQMATYANMLKQNGFSLKDIRTYVAPIKLENFKKVGGTWQFDDISYFDHVEEIDFLTDSNIQTSVSKFFPEVQIVDANADEISSTVENDYLTETFGGEYEYSAKADVSKITEKVMANAVYNEETKKYSIEYFKGQTMVESSRELLIKKIIDIIEDTPKRRYDRTIQVQREITEAIRLRKDEDPNAQIQLETEGTNPTWAANYLSKYISGNWEVVENVPEIVTYYGMIVLKNKVTNQLDVIMVTNKNTKEKHKLGKDHENKLIIGNYRPDIEEQAKTDSIVVDCLEGNIEIMKGMVILNQITSLFNDEGTKIGRISCINPRYGGGLDMNGELLKENWEALIKNNKKLRDKDHTKDGVIKFASRYDVFLNAFVDIFKQANTNSSISAKFQRFHSAFSKIEEVNSSQLRDQLISLKNQMEAAFPGIKEYKQADFNTHPEAELYQYLLLAISETAGIRTPQIYEDGSLYIDSMAILTKGLSGMELDNPGNLPIQSLNKITKMVLNVYQNVRSSMQKQLPSIRKLTEQLENETGQTGFKKHTYGIAADMYKDMWYYDEQEGDFFLQNPWSPECTLSTTKKNWLKMFLTKVNEGRFPEKIKTLNSTVQNSKDAFFRLPLAKGDTASAISACDGLFPALKSKLTQFTPTNIVQTFKDNVQGFINDDTTEKNTQLLWEMNTTFDIGETNSRRKAFIAEYINKYGKGYFEFNLETLLYKHMFAYTTKTQMDAIFPDIQAIYFLIKAQEFTGNTKFTGIDTYLNEFINAKVLGKRIDSDKFTAVQAYTGTLMSVASHLALAFNPRQLYQNIEGMWKDISLVIRKPDGTERFTFSNMRDSFLSTLPEMINMKNSRTKWIALNELYAINDMGNNEYANRIKSDKFGFIQSFNRWMFKFASRPDFYNRATIFGAQMRGDGCWDAHEFTEDGELIYHPEKDERFKAFILEDHSDEAAYNKAKGLYIAIGKQLEIEHAFNSDGKTYFKLYNEDKTINKNLPKAYSSQESDGLKDVADTMYGYYSNERKALVQAHGLGAIIFQMNTFWSSKKNQWLAPGGVKLQGKMVQYEEPILDDAGNKTGSVKFYLTKDGDSFVPEGDENASEIPYMVWKGDFQEGIMVTLTKILWANPTEWLENYRKLYNISDENLRRAYRANLAQLYYDMAMAGIMGGIIVNGILKTQAKAYIKGTNNPFARFAADYGTNILSASFMDFNAFESVFGRVTTDWTPFSIGYTKRVLETWSNILGEDHTFMDCVITSSGAMRATKYLWEPFNK